MAGRTGSGSLHQRSLRVRGTGGDRQPPEPRLSLALLTPPPASPEGAHADRPPARPLGTTTPPGASGPPTEGLGRGKPAPRVAAAALGEQEPGGSRASQGAQRRRPGRAGGGWRKTGRPRGVRRAWHKGQRHNRLCPQARPSADLAQRSRQARPDPLHPPRPEEWRRRRLRPSGRSPGPPELRALRRSPTARPRGASRRWIRPPFLGSLEAPLPAAQCAWP